jgi:hypothetical protein
LRSIARTPFAKQGPATMKSSSPYETAGFAGALAAAWLQARQGRRQAFVVGKPGFGTALGCSKTYGNFGYPGEEDLQGPRH